jgi:hypothetical protein
MTLDPNNPEAGGAGRTPGPSQDDLDGWLARHPEVFGESGDLSRLRELWQSAAPPEPGPAAWEATLSRIEGALPPGTGGNRRGRRWTLWGAFGMTAAAALVSAGLLARPWWSGSPPPAGAAEEPYPVVESHEVNIISMAARDTGGLVVGQPPVTGDLVFVAPADIKVIRVEPRPGGGAPRLHQGGDVPMFVPVVRADGEEDD